MHRDIAAKDAAEKEVITAAAVHLEGRFDGGNIPFTLTSTFSANDLYPALAAHRSRNLPHRICNGSATSSISVTAQRLPITRRSTTGRSSRSNFLAGAVGFLREIRASRAGIRHCRMATRCPVRFWFTGSRLNFAENLLRRRDAADALVFRRRRHQPPDQLRRTVPVVAQLAAPCANWALARRPRRWLHAQSAANSDCHAGPSNQHWRSLVVVFARFRHSGCARPFRPDRAEVLFTADGYVCAGKQIDCLQRVADIAAQLPSLLQLIVVPHLQPGPDIGSPPHAALWADCLDRNASEIELPSCRSTTRCTSCIRPAPPACRNALSTRPAALCCNS